MIRHKRKHVILYDTEGKSFVVPNFNIIKPQKDKQVVEPIQPLEPPHKPEKPSFIPLQPKYKPDPPPQLPKKTQITDRPGGIDPNYRHMPGPTLQLYADRPGKIDPSYRYIDSTLFKDAFGARQPNPLQDQLSGKPISDAEGLKRAYESNDNLYVYGDTLYISGTKTVNDWKQNIQYIGVPFVESMVNDNIGTIAGALAVAQPELAPEIGLMAGALNFGKTQESKDVKDDMKVKVYMTDRYKEASQVMQANPNIKKVVGHSLGGGVALELQKRYTYLTGNVYGTPYWDPKGKDAIKSFLESQRTYNNNIYGDKWYNAPAKFVDNKLMNLVESAIGVQNADEHKGINRYRNAGDIVAIADNSAITAIHPNPFSKSSFVHDYSNQASQNSVVDTKNVNGWVNADKTISLTA
jgi:hypothetical protein